MKRILHIIPTLASGGAERQLANLICTSNAAEFSHFVCVFKDAEFFAPTIREAGHQVRQLDTFGKHPWYAATAKINSIIRDEYKPDLITTWLYDASIVGRLVHFSNRKIPLICTLHLTDYDRETIRGGGWSPVKVEGLRWVDKLTAKLTDPYFTACSNEVKRSYRNNLGIAESKIKVIYNGVDPELLKCDADAPQRLRRELEIPDDGFVYISVGRLAPQKNYPMLLKTFVQVLAAVPQAYLVLAGVGSLERELKDMVLALNINHRVLFLGRRSDVGALLEMADAFVMTSFFEGHPLALVEAMFKNLPSVASNIEVLREVLTDGENGLLFDLDKPDELAAAMIKLARQPELGEKLSERALADAERRFPIRRTISEWEDFYHQVISNGLETK